MTTRIVHGKSYENEAVRKFYEDACREYPKVTCRERITAKGIYVSIYGYDKEKYRYVRVYDIMVG